MALWRRASPTDCAAEDKPLSIPNLNNEQGLAVPEHILRCARNKSIAVQLNQLEFTHIQILKILRHGFHTLI